MGWFSQIRSPLLCRVSIAVWRLFTDLDLSDAKKQRFTSLHDCFTRELVEGARPVDHGPRRAEQPLRRHRRRLRRGGGRAGVPGQGFPVRLARPVRAHAGHHGVRDGVYVTLRLTSSMYHRFHAPHDCEVDHVTYLSGDTWNVNPIALARVERLFCRNERAVLRATSEPGRPRHRAGAGGGHPGGEHPAALPGRAAAPALPRAQRDPCRTRFNKGEEMGWFEHGSTIIVFAPRGFALCEGIEAGATIRMGRALMRLPPQEAAAVSA